MHFGGIRLYGFLISIGIGLLTAPATVGQPAEPLTREQLRTRILDLCVLTEAPKAGPKVAVAPKCGCYARGLSQVMSPEDATYFAEKRALPPKLRDQATQVYAKCSEA